MNRFIVFLIAGVLGFIVAFSLTRSIHRAPALLNTMPELEWLRNELKLDDAQLAKAAELHKTYLPRCETLCARILEVRQTVEAAATGARGKLTPELTAALDAQARVHVECQKAMIGHLYETAAVMTPEQAERYLKATLPYAINLSSYQNLRAH